MFQYQDCCLTRLDILIVGQSRHGKSSFINALVGAEVAKVGHIGDCTKEVTEYSLPNYPSIKIYDAAGISAAGCTENDFEAKAKLKENNYDAFFLVIKDVFNNDANFIIEKIEAKKKPFSIIRTHADLAAEESYSKGQSRVATEKNVSTEIREVLKSQLITLKADPEKTPIYVVDNKHTDRFDFPKIIEDLSRNLPKMKPQQFQLWVTSFDASMIKAKYKELNNLKWECALMSGAGCLTPIPGLNIVADVGIFIATTVSYLSSFGLTKGRINAQEKLHRIPKFTLEKKVVKFMQDNKLDVLLAIRNSPHFEEGLKVSSTGTTKLETVVVPLLTTADDVLKANGVLTGLGMAVGAVTSFGMTWYLLDRELKNAKFCALFVSQLIESKKTE